MTITTDNRSLPAIDTTAGVASQSRPEWADVAILPVNPNVLPIARAVEQALAGLGLSCCYLWTTLPEEREQHWGATDTSGWRELTVPVRWNSSTPLYTAQMVGGLRSLQRTELRSKFAVFATFIDAGWAPRLFGIVCRQQGIPSMLLQEGVTFQRRAAPEPRTLRYRSGKVLRRIRKQAAGQLFASEQDGLSLDHACVYGAAQAEELAAQGTPSERLTITGNPLFDQLSPRPITAQPRGRTILYAHQLLCDDLMAEAAWWRALIGASEQLHAKLIFKVHPRAGLTPDRLRSLLGAYDEQAVQFVFTGDIQDMIAQADVFVAACSASAYRALVEGVPVVLLEGLPSPFRLDLTDYNAALRVDTPGELVTALGRALDDPQTRLHLQPGVDLAIERHLYRLDGGAARRMAAAITNLV